jgi:alpha-1,2-rhamnosyltransferase
MSVIFIECGTTLKSPFNTGIQRVVRNIVRESLGVGNSLGHQCVPVHFVNGDFYVLDLSVAIIKPHSGPRWAHLFALFATKVDRRLKLLIPKKLHKMIRTKFTPFIRNFQNKYLLGPLGLTIKEFLTQRVNIAHGQAPTSPPVLLLLDSSWDVNMWDAMDEFRTFGGRVCGVLYDLIPFTHPHTVEDSTLNLHTTWWKQAPLHMDSLMCISQTVRSEYLQWQDQQEFAHPLTPEQVGYFYLGSELNTISDVTQVVNIFLKNEPYYLVVGSIEPRKNHSLILDAFELLWLDEGAPNLVIVGGNGWKSELLIRRIKNHQLYNQKLYLFERTNDTELACLYRNTAALIIASFAEGFGLPIVEAFQHGAKVICSDIPVFREIATQRAEFFDVFSSRDLADKVGQNLRHISPPSIINPAGPTEWLTWEESASQLINRLFKCIETSR